MKESILFSKTINAILSVFFANSSEKYYLRQLCSLINSSPRPVQLALEKLTKAGILNFERKANIKFYSLNKQSPIYNELRGIIFKTEVIGEILSKNLKKIKNIKCAFIYGSVAKDKEKRGSDIDICIIGEVDLTILSRVMSQLEDKLKREISTVTFIPSEWAQAIKAKKAFVMDILKNKKIVLLGNLDEV